jgi:hypothetical protein
MKRRTFIYLAGATALAVPFVRCHHYSSTLTRSLSQPDFLGHICDEATIRDIGAAYRVRTPDEAKEDKLVSLLLPQQLDVAIHNDYTTGKVVTVKGWVLSLTEARQCALYSLSQ